MVKVGSIGNGLGIIHSGLRTLLIQPSLLCINTDTLGHVLRNHATLLIV